MFKGSVVFIIAKFIFDVRVILPQWDKVAIWQLKKSEKRADSAKTNLQNIYLLIKLYYSF